tara:strand:+ start:6915 stop:7163 length:249 start_codon:yes stop_codon:yes gene_type:complete
MQIVEYATNLEIDNFLKEIEKHPSVKELSKYYNKPIKEIVKALRCRVIVNQQNNEKIVRLKFTDKDSGLKIKTKKSYRFCAT